MDEHFRPNRGTRVAITRRGTFATGVQLHPRIAGWRRDWKRWWRGGRRLGERKRGKGDRRIEGQEKRKERGGERRKEGRRKEAGREMKEG